MAKTGKMIGFDGHNFVVRMKQPPISGKLIDGLVPTKENALRILRWYDDYDFWKIKRRVLETQIQQAENEEVQKEYKKELVAHINTYRPSPDPGKVHMCRWRVDKTILDNNNEQITFVKPAFHKDIRTLRRIGY